MTTTAISNTTQPNRLSRAFAYYAAYIMLGLSLAALGPTLPGLAEQTGTSLSQISVLFTTNSLGYIVGSLLGSRLYDTQPGQPVLFVTMLSFSALIFFVPILNVAWMLMLNLALIGIAMGVLDVGGNTLMVWLFGKDVRPYMNALHLCFGIGAFLSPLLIESMVSVTGSIRGAYWLFAALMLPVAVWMIRIPSPERPGTGSAEAARPLVRVHYILIGILAVFFFLHLGSEIAFGGWIYSYAQALNIGQQATARLLNSVYWGGLVLGRLVAIPLAVRLAPATMLLIDLLGAAVSLGVVYFLPGWAPALWIGTAGFGFFLASIFATSINYAEERMPITGLVTGIILVGGNAGAMSLPWLVGQLFETNGPISMVVVISIAIVLALALFGVMQVYTRRFMSHT